MEGPVDCGKSGEAGDTVLGCGGHYLTSTLEAFIEQRSFVCHFYQKEAGGRSGGAGGGAIRSRNDFGDGMGGDTTGACLGEGAYKVANHVVEEAGSCHSIDEDLFLPEPTRAVDGAKGSCMLWLVGRQFGGACGEIGVRCSERSEVVGAYDVSGCLLKLLEIKSEGAGPDVRGEHRRADAACRVDAILVGFTDGAVTGVEAGWCVVDGEDANAGRKSAIEGSVKVGGRNGSFEGERGYLCEGVNSGVSAA